MPDLGILLRLLTSEQNGGSGNGGGEGGAFLWSKEEVSTEGFLDTDRGGEDIFRTEFVQVLFILSSSDLFNVTFLTKGGDPSCILDG